VPALSNSELIKTFRDARSDPGLAVLEGFHALKHALRFGASIGQSVMRDRQSLLALTRELAPDLIDTIDRTCIAVSASLFDELAPAPPETGVISIARRSEVSAATVLAATQRAAPVVLLERPAHRGNVGAVIRVAAAAGAGAVITTGPLDPWDPAVIRGSAGLHYAIDVARADDFPDIGGPVIAVDPDGEALSAGAIPQNAILAFGSERRGLSDGLRARADRSISVPMQAGVSSLNLATAVAVVLYAWRLSQ
jgi:tRNA G18 (ribose-2'-O)-methylase SpoU